MAKGQNIIDILKEFKSVLSEQMGAAPIETLPGAEMQLDKPTRKPTKVNFDKNTDNPFSVVFSERGFLLNGTRLSFEELETAISKNYNITLDGGNGMALDAVKMQKILKYKDLF